MACTGFGLTKPRSDQRGFDLHMDQAYIIDGMGVFELVSIRMALSSSNFVEGKGGYEACEPGLPTLIAE
jgi:hypothetical protein